MASLYDDRCVMANPAKSDTGFLTDSQHSDCDDIINLVDGLI